MLAKQQPRTAYALLPLQKGSTKYDFQYVDHGALALVENGDPNQMHLTAENACVTHGTSFFLETPLSRGSEYVSGP